MIGSFGDIVFEVSDKRIRTFDEFVRTIAGRWVDHEIIGKKPLSQWIGPGLDTISFKMRFDIALGLNPRIETDKLITIEREGKPYTLTIGNKGLGVYKWVITNLEVEYTTIDHKGNILVAEARLELKEWVK